MDFGDEGSDPSSPSVRSQTMITRIAFTARYEWIGKSRARCYGNRANAGSRMSHKKHYINPGEAREWFGAGGRLSFRSFGVAQIH
jgi:hypothetical protein